MLHDVGEIGEQAKWLGNAIGGRGGEVVVEPIIIKWVGRNQGAIGCGGA